MGTSLSFKINPILKGSLYSQTQKDDSLVPAGAAVLSLASTVAFSTFTTVGVTFEFAICSSRKVTRAFSVSSSSFRI